MLLIEDDHVIVDELPTDGPHELFDERSLPGRTRCCENLLDPDARYPTERRHRADSAGTTRTDSWSRPEACHRSSTI